MILSFAEINKRNKQTVHLFMDTNKRSICLRERTNERRKVLSIDVKFVHAGTMISYNMI